MSLDLHRYSSKHISVLLYLTGSNEDLKWLSLRQHLSKKEGGGGMIATDFCFGSRDTTYFLTQDAIASNVESGDISMS